ncbi:hypothetical protein ACLOJK_007277 [Asimina triloba]
MLPFADYVVYNRKSQHHRQQTSSLLLVFSGFDCYGDDMVTVDELCLALHRLGFEAAANELETVVKSHIRANNSSLVFNEFMALQ